MPPARCRPALAAGPIRHCIGGYRVEFSDPRGSLQFRREAVRERQGKEALAQQQCLTGTESGTLGLRIAMQMHDIGIGRRNEGVEIGKPFQPRPGMIGAVNAQIGEKIVARQSANAQAIGNDDILRGRTGVNLLEQFWIIGDAPLQFRERAMARVNECDLPGIAHDGTALRRAETV